MSEVKRKTKRVVKEYKSPAKKKRYSGKSPLEIYNDLSEQVKALTLQKKELAEKIKDIVSLEPSGRVSIDGFTASICEVRGREQVNITNARKILGEKIEPFIYCTKDSTRLTVKKD